MREDFVECCAYCLLHEYLAGGERSFEIDHFRPKGLPEHASLRDDFWNLYYSCRSCNQRKGSHWPESELERAGYGFVDYCGEPFSAHFEQDADGRWSPLSPEGEYTSDKLALNTERLRRLRGWLDSASRSTGLPPLDWNRPIRSQMLGLLFGAD